MKVNLKKWHSFADQLSLLKSRGLEVSNEEKALEYLERIGYYRLSGYWYPFRNLCPNDPEQRSSNFMEGSNFQDIIRLFVFDKKLRLLALDALERIELAVRVDIAYLLGKRGPLYYLDERNFNKNKHSKWLKQYLARLSRAQNEDFFIHHKKNYKGQLPIWVSIETWDFGLLSHFYAQMKLKDKILIAEKYGAHELNSKHKVLFEQWLRSFNQIRNISAHHARLWNKNIQDRSAISRNFCSLGKTLNNHKPFYYFYLIKLMLDVICPNSSWSERFASHLQKFPNNLPPQVSLEDMGAVNGWEKLFMKQ